MYACMYTYVHNVCRCGCTYSYICTYVHTYVLMYTYVRTCVSIYVHTYVRMYQCTLIHACIHSYVRIWVYFYSWPICKSAFHTYIYPPITIHPYHTFIMYSEPGRSPRHRDTSVHTSPPVSCVCCSLIRTLI